MEACSSRGSFTVASSQEAALFFFSSILLSDGYAFSEATAITSRHDLRPICSTLLKKGVKRDHGFGEAKWQVSAKLRSKIYI